MQSPSLSSIRIAGWPKIRPAELVYWLAAIIPLAFLLTTSHPVLGITAVCLVSAGLIGGRMVEAASRRQALRAAFLSSCRDDLTSLPNRRLFLQELNESLARPLSRDGQTCVFFIDIDNFKTINDTLGHTAGDRVLIEISSRLRQVLPPEHTLARMGGDELTILAHEVPDRQCVVALAQSLMDVFSRPVIVGGDEVWVNASMGIVVAAMPRPGPDDLLSMADTALYSAKRHGKGQFIIFEPNLPRPTRLQLSLDADLRSAVARNELVLHFQPIADLKTMTVAGFEALIRWQHPRYGLLPPKDFIPLAEESGLIRSLGSWIIERGCEQISVWQSLSGTPLVLSLNLSVLQFRQKDILAHLAASSARAGLQPGTLQLEITESILIQNDPTTLKTINDLHSQGFGIAVDDFGVGYSSLGYLKSFDVDVLKLDQSFLSDMEDPRSEALLRGAIELGKSLDVTVLAEGIETEHQLKVLREAGCHQGQGYLLGKPITEKQVTELLLSGALLWSRDSEKEASPTNLREPLYWNAPQTKGSYYSFE